MTMRIPMSPSKQHSAVGVEWSRKYLPDSDCAPASGFFLWWYRLTAPPDAPFNADLEQRELVRRGRLCSLILFYLIIVLLTTALPAGIATSNRVILLVVPLVLAIICIAALFNRRGRSAIAGLLISFGLNGGLFIVILTSPGGLGASSLSLFDLLVFSELIVASLLPANWVFVAALINIIFIVATLSSMPRAVDLAYAMQSASHVIILRPVALHLVVTVILWIWVRSATRAINRADRAETIAALQHTIALQEYAKAKEKRALETSIQLIMQTHLRVAKGDLNARVPLNEGNALWPVAVSLNNLLFRLQRLRQIEYEYQHMLPRLQRANQLEYELQRTRDEITHLLPVIREARAGTRPIRFTRSGTLLDPLVQDLNGCYLARRPVATPDRPSVF